MDRALELFERVFGDPGANLGAMGVALLFVVGLQFEQQAHTPGEFIVFVAAGAVVFFIGIEKLAAIAVLAGLENQEIAAALAPEDRRAGGDHGRTRVEFQFAVGKLYGHNAAIAFLQRRFDHPAFRGIEIGYGLGRVSHERSNASLE